MFVCAIGLFTKPLDIDHIVYIIGLFCIVIEFYRYWDIIPMN